MSDHQLELIIEITRIQLKPKWWFSQQFSNSNVFEHTKLINLIAV